MPDAKMYLVEFVTSAGTKHTATMTMDENGLKEMKARIHNAMVSGKPLEFEGLDVPGMGKDIFINPAQLVTASIAPMQPAR